LLNDVEIGEKLVEADSTTREVASYRVGSRSL
jgi:hypothetical protein